MSRGVLLYAHNNPEIDYVKIACANALMIQKNLSVPVTLVTDEGSIGWAKISLGEQLLDQCFENIVIVDKDYGFKNPRIFQDTSFSSKTLEFYNCNHWAAYELSPYDETLFIDADYLIMSSVLSNCWGCEQDFLIDNRILSPGESLTPYKKYIDDTGIPLYWATVIYFKKTEFSHAIFSMVRHVQENYGFYRDLYCLNSGMFRNDNAFSIAVHTINGHQEYTDAYLGCLPIPALLMSWDRDDILSIESENEIVLYTEKSDCKGTYTLTRLKDQDVHIMNKWAINRFSDKIIELYKGKK